MTTRALALLATMAGTTLSITACSVSLSVDDQNQSSIAVENNITTADSRATPEPPSWFAVVDGKEITPPSIPMGDRATIERILDEGQHHSEVMSILSKLTETYGPRLTGSTNL